MEKIETAEAILDCLKLFDASTPRKISERVGNLDEYAEKLAQNAHNYYIKRDSQIVAYISFYANKKNTAYISVIAVSEKYKGCGLGTLMLNKAMLIAKEKGMKNIRLEVDKQNHNAINFYKKNNFKTEINNTEQSIYMIKEL